MKKTTIVSCCLLAGTLGWTGCGGTEGELLAALRTEENRTLCVPPQTLGVDAFEANDGKRYVARAGDWSFFGQGASVDALERLREKGYVRREPTSLPRSFASTFDAYEITPKGASFLRPDAFGAGFEACIGRKTATEIVEWTEPGGAGGPQAIQARFRYELGLNDFVRDLEVEDALEAELARSWPGEGMAVFVKTNKGWRLEQAFWQ